MPPTKPGLAVDRYANKILVTASGCWEWQGTRLRFGYGRVNYQGLMYLAHRVFYTEHVGPIPDGLHLDHLCRNPPCVNPAHLEPVTPRENQARGLRNQSTLVTHCPYGHPYDAVNTVQKVSGSRACRECQRQRSSRNHYRRLGTDSITARARAWARQQGIPVADRAQLARSVLAAYRSAGGA